MFALTTYIGCRNILWHLTNFKLKTSYFFLLVHGIFLFKEEKKQTKNNDSEIFSHIRNINATKLYCMCTIVYIFEINNNIA